jgi:aminoglycoside phosphotransferase (APT) family kinase protein
MAIEPFGQGLDHTAYLVDGRLVVRFAHGDGAAREVEREARLLGILAELSPLPVPRPVLVVPEAACLAYERLPGVPLIDLTDGRSARLAAVVAECLGAFLAALHRIPHERVAAVVDRDDEPPEAWLAEARQHYELVGPTLPDEHREAVERFLEQPPPPAVDELVFSHNDLGIEHVLVDPSTLDVAGIIDWTDAALTDPAVDFGLLFRDLGEPALAAALRAYGDTSDGLAPRARFYAGCALLEDMAFGMATTRTEYVSKSLAGLAWVFPRT